MGDWDLPLTDYWDQQTGAIGRHALRLKGLDEPAREAACRRIGDAVRRQAHALADLQLQQAAVSMVDDLYKCVNDEVMHDTALYDYVGAFGRTMCEVIRERGYVVRYIAENEFSDLEFLRLGPFGLFRNVFRAAGFVYICPQMAAYELARERGASEENLAAAMAQANEEARMLGRLLVDRCTAEARHFVFLEADYEDGALEHALKGVKDPGVLTVFRNEAPLPGTTVSCSFPDQKREPPR